MGVARFGVSLGKELLSRFDSLWGEKKYQNRSEAIRDLIRDALVAREWERAKGTVAGIISLVYDHHRRELVDGLIDIQHDHQDMIVSSQHIHLDHDNCLEVVAVKGSAVGIRTLAFRLRSAKGVKHGGLIMTTLGSGIK